MHERGTYNRRGHIVEWVYGYITRVYNYAGPLSCILGSNVYVYTRTHTCAMQSRSWLATIRVGEIPHFGKGGEMGVDEQVQVH